MRIEYLRSFVAVAKNGSFSLAAEELYTTQSNVSKHVQALERELGVQLLQRDARPLRLSDAGQTLVDGLPALLANFDELVQAAIRQKPPLRVGVFPVVGHYGVAQLLYRFAAQHPEAKLQMQEVENADLSLRLAQCEFDMVVLRDTGPRDANFDYLELESDSLTLAVPAGHPLATREGPHSLADFREEPFILLGHKTGLYEQSLAACRQAGFAPNVVYVGSSTHTIVDLVAKGMGVALFMSRVAEGTRDDRLRFLPICEAQPCGIQLARRRGQATGPAQALWAFIAAEK